MPRVDFERQLDRKAIYDRLFFLRLFKELRQASFTDISVYVPPVYKLPLDDERDNSLNPVEPEVFLKKNEKLPGIVVVAYNKDKGDRLEFYVANTDPRDLFPNDEWGPGTKHGVALIRVTSYDADRPYAISGHFQQFAKVNSEARSFEERPIFGYMAVFGVILDVVSLIKTGRFTVTNMFDAPWFVGVLVFLLYISIILTTFLPKRGLVLFEGPSPLANSVRDIVRGKHNKNLILIIIVAIVSGTIATILGTAIYDWIKAH